MAVRPPYETVESPGQHRILGTHNISAGGLCGERFWTAATVPDSRSVVGPGAVVTYRMGILG